MPLTQEQVPWGAASMLIRRHGDQAQMIAVQRISELSALDDQDGVAMWKKIVTCIAQMTADGTRQ